MIYIKKILCACSNGMGTSIIIKIKVEQILKELNIEGQVTTASVSEAKGIADKFDVVLCAKYLYDDLQEHASTIVVGIENLLDGEQIKKALTDAFF